MWDKCGRLLDSAAGRLEADVHLETLRRWCEKFWHALKKEPEKLEHIVHHARAVLEKKGVKSQIYSPDTVMAFTIALSAGVALMIPIVITLKAVCRSAELVFVGMLLFWLCTNKFDMQNSDTSHGLGHEAAKQYSS